MNRDYVATHYVGPERLRFTEEEKGRHRDRSVCKARGGSPLLLGARSRGRWDPACSCGWRNASNEGRREAERAWKDHRRGAVWEERQLAEGLPLLRVLVVHENGGAPIREWRAIESEEYARQLAKNDSTRFAVAHVERSSDGEKWERV